MELTIHDDTSLVTGMNIFWPLMPTWYTCIQKHVEIPLGMNNEAITK